MFKDRLKAQKDSVLRTPLLDTLLLIYDARAKFFPKSASNALGRKAVDMLDFIPGQNQRIREAFEVAVQVGVRPPNLLFWDIISKSPSRNTRAEP